MHPINSSQTTCHLTLLSRHRGDKSYHLDVATSDSEAPFAHEIHVRRWIDKDEPLVRLRDRTCILQDLG